MRLFLFFARALRSWLSLGTSGLAAWRLVASLKGSHAASRSTFASPVRKTPGRIQKTTRLGVVFCLDLGVFTPIQVEQDKITPATALQRMCNAPEGCECCR